MINAHTESVREWAWVVGAEEPERDWLLHDWDVWVRNPHFVGEPGPHPEMAEYYEELEAGPVPAPVDLDDEIPF